MKPGGNAGGLLAVAIIALVVGTLAVALRTYTRKIILDMMWYDDYTAIASWFCLIGLVIQNFHNISTGLGSHMSEIPVEGLTDFFKDLWVGLVVYQITLFFTKLTLFFQFYRIMRQTPGRTLKEIYIAIMFLITAWQIGQVFVQIFACIPVQASWDKTIVGAKCQTIAVTRDMNSIANIVTDFIILLMPLPVIWRLALPRDQKCVVSGIFSLGFLTCIISILRVTTTPDTTDIAWDTVHVVAWTTAEILTGVIIASVTTLRPLLARYFPRFATQASESSKASGGTKNSYRMESLQSRGTPGPSRSDRLSAMVSPSRKLSAGAWLDLSESDQDVSTKGIKAPDAATLEAGMARPHEAARLQEGGPSSSGPHRHDFGHERFPMG